MCWSPLLTARMRLDTGVRERLLCGPTQNGAFEQGDWKREGRSRPQGGQLGILNAEDVHPAERPLWVSAPRRLNGHCRP
jgi:hypothetical protein